MVFRSFLFASSILSFLAFVSSAELCYGCEKDIELTDDKITEVSKHVRNYLKTQYSKDELDKIIKIRSQTVSGIKTTVDFLTHNSENQKQKRCTMKYVKQPWIVDDPHVLDFMCKPHREKKQLLGEPKQVDSSENELLLQLGQVVTNTFDEIDEDTTKKVLVKILEAKKQLVNGIMYHMKIEIKNTNCPENQETNEKCLNEEIEPRKICNVTVHRSFADNSPLNAKLINSECSSVEDTLLGSPVTVSANDKYIQEVAEFVMNHINMMSNSIYIKNLRQIIDAKTQLVSGTRIDLTITTANTDCTKNDKNRTVCNFLDQHPENSICKVTVLDKDKHKKILNFHCDTQRFKRSAALGEEQEIDVNDSKIQGLKELIANELTQRANSLYKKTVVKIFKAKTQVISGSLTTVTVEVADTNCLKSENKALSECVSQSEQGRQICEITIREKPWLNKVEIPHSECHSVSSLTSTRKIIQKFAHFFEVDENDKHLNDFFKFIERENREYKSPDELKKRFRIFRANMKKAATLQEYEQGTGKYGATKFADLSSQEFKKYLGYNYNPDYVSKTLKTALIPNVSLPTSFDWRDHGAVTPVKNQGSCGSCWAFSVTGNIEGLYAIKNNELKSFSEQELVDCDKYDNGCNGGLFDTAYHAIEDLGGLELESDYPYDGVKETCEIKSPEIEVSINGGLNISQDENDIAKFLVANGPISIAINANAMQFYMGGVSHPFKFLCNPKNLDHGVLIVGYGIHKTKYTKKMLPYWLVKNSWGKSWGEQGYYMVYRGDGTCGVNQMPCTAILAD